MPAKRLLALVLTLLVGLLASDLLPSDFLIAELHAGDAKKKAVKAKHLDYRATYAEALLEARIRNLPVFVSRHKDF